MSNERRKRLEVKVKFDFELLLLVNKYYIILSALFFELIKISVDYIGKKDYPIITLICPLIAMEWTIFRKDLR